MAFLKYSDGEKAFTPLIITVESPEALQILFDMVRVANHVAKFESTHEACAAEMQDVIDDHAKVNDIKLNWPEFKEMLDERT